MFTKAWTAKAPLIGIVLAICTLSASAQQDTAAQIAEKIRQGKPVLQLTLRQAVQIALAPEGNARAQLAEELINQAHQQMLQSRAPLLPDFEGAITQESLTRNLAAFGIQISLPFVGFTLPRLAGPFSNFDARANFTQNIFDISSIRRYQASRATEKAVKADNDDARDQVTGDVANAYLAAQRAQASVEAIKANVALAEALEKQATDQKNAGTGTGLDVTRAAVQLANERQRLLVAENDVTQTRLQLLKAMNLDLDVQVDVSDAMDFKPVPAVTVDQAITTAVKRRPNLKAQLERQNSARLNYNATKLERVPTVVGFADYGSNGTAIDFSIPTRTYGITVRVPLFDGGRRDARRAESFSEYEQQQIRTRDLEQQVKLEVRVALDALRSATDQVKVAQEGLDLSEQELAQARRRFVAGIANTIEVVDAQSRLERSRDNKIEALYNYNLARIKLAQSMGTIQQDLP